MSDDAAERPITRRSFVERTSASALAVRLGVTAPGSQPAAEPQPAEHATGITLTVNGTRHRISLEPRVTLLDALRDRLGLTGTKKGCDWGTCGACTVLVNGRRVLSCFTLAVMHQNDRITTIEGIAGGERLHPIQAAFVKHDGFQCGYCTSGQIVSAAGMLAEGHRLDRETVAVQMSGNLCRCGCYSHIVDAILDARAPV